MLMIPAEQLWVPVIKTCCSIVSCIDANNKIDSVTISPHFQYFLKYNKMFKNIICPVFKGVWIINGEDVFYNQYSTVTFLCPMRWGWSWSLSSKSSSISKNHDICTFLRFERYPLDEHICKFRVGSTNMDINFMRFAFNSDWLFVFSTFMIFYSLKRMIKIL